MSAFTQRAREQIEGAFSKLWVEGEISNFVRHSSGHCYFTLKDPDAQIRCVMWRSSARSLYFNPTDGMQVRLYGRASVYEKRGDLQLIAQSLRHAGEGALQQAFEALKQQLFAEGLFDAAHKKSIPAFPVCIGVVTSETGAALHDILSILERRFPLVEVVVCNALVQGLDAAPSICRAIDGVNQLVNRGELRVDALIVGRGGGSLEDLWAFNEESVARAIFASRIPVVSAVGHETDVTIADFVADVRAATPSMAAELATPDGAELLAYLRGAGVRASDAILRLIGQHRQYVQSLTVRRGFSRPLDLLAQMRQRLDELGLRLKPAGERYLKQRHEEVVHLQRQLHLVDPMRPLKKGYVQVEQEGRFIRSASDVSGKHDIILRFHDGKRLV